MNRCSLSLRVAFLFLLVFVASPSLARSQAPVYKITPVGSSIEFVIDSSVPLTGTFTKWTATFVFKTREVSTAVLDLKIQADSVDTGSDVKNGKLCGKDFFNAKEDPYITFHSSKITQTGPTAFVVEGDFTIRGVTRKEKLVVSDKGKGTPVGTITGSMAFDRKDYGMDSSIPFIRIANRVQVNVNLKWKRVAGQPPAFTQ